MSNRTERKKITCIEKMASDIPHFIILYNIETHPVENSFEFDYNRCCSTTNSV